MSVPDPQTLARLLRSTLNGDARYRRFVRLLDSPHSDGMILFWQSKALDDLEAREGVVLTRRAEDLRTLLPPLPEPLVLEAQEVPEWIRIESLGGASPVQGEGTAGAWRWYFHSRHSSWSLSAVLGSQVDPADVYANADGAFYTEHDYGDFPFDASYMALGEARYLIVRELTRLKASHGLGEILSASPQKPGMLV